MSEFGSLALIILIGCIGNVTGAIQNKRQVPPVLLANAILFLVLAMIGSFGAWGVAKGLAVLYLIGTLLGNGVALVNLFTSLATGVANTAATK